MLERLPLFPLGQPLFPGIRLHLQIFEQRYLRLIRDCMREESAFGIVAIAEGMEVGEAPEIFQFGLEVKVVDWRQHDNGLLGVTVSGGRRFSVTNTMLEPDGLIIGEVEWLPDNDGDLLKAGPSSFLPKESLDGLENLLRDLAQHPALDWVELREQLSPEELGWKLAQVLPVPTDRKVLLLAEPDTEVRLIKIQELVGELSNI